MNNMFTGSKQDVFAWRWCELPANPAAPCIITWLHKPWELREVMVCLIEYYVNVRRGKCIPGKKKGKKIALFMCPTSQLLFQSSRLPPPSEKGPAALLRGSLVLVWLTPSTAASPLGGFTHNLGGPCRISFKSRAQIIVWTRKCISALSCSSSCHSAS